MKENKFKKDKESQLLALRAMVASFVIYDHGNSEYGAFQRKSHTKAQKIISMICNDYVQLNGGNIDDDNDDANDNDDDQLKQEINGLVNMIKFASAHFNDQSTPASIKNLINNYH